MRFVLSTLLMFSLVAMLGCTEKSGEETSSAKPINDHCPIMGGEVTSDGGTAEWNGQIVGFCCPQCIDDWQALSDEEKTEALAHAGEEHAGHDHDAHEGDHHANEHEAETKKTGDAS